MISAIQRRILLSTYFKRIKKPGTKHVLCHCLKAYDLQKLMCDRYVSFFSRPTAAQALEHKWIVMHLDAPPSIQTSKTSVLHSSVRSSTFQKFLAMQKLKKAALSVIAKSLTADEVSSLGDIFRRIDQSGDGVMTLTELDNAITSGT